VDVKVSSLFSIEGEKAIVVGGGSGIGKATAALFSEAGADVVIADINVDSAREASAELSASGARSLAVQVDVADPLSVAKMVETVLTEFKCIDILINSAGINRRIPAEDLEEIDWDAVVDINLKGTFLTCQHVGRHMIKQKSGKIINLASMSGLVTNKGKTNTVYCSSKGGVIMLTKSLAVEWARHNIRVNAIAPGYVKTPLTRAWMEDPVASKPTLDLIPMGRFCETTEIASSALYLAARASSYLTGSILIVDGGYTCY
jgi:NAD(P)-dependent dehydrogenase (short-subunit alcohol dehydrogenase family)